MCLLIFKSHFSKASNLCLAIIDSRELDNWRLTTLFGVNELRLKIASF